MIKNTLLHLLATFLIWFVTVLAIGIGIVISLKLLDLIIGLPQWLNG